MLERTYNVPLRREWLKAPKYKRAKKAVTALRQFLIKHMKPGLDKDGKYKFKIGKQLNLHLWKHGIKNPPHHVKINVTKDDDGVVKVELFGHKYVDVKNEEKKEKTAIEKAKEKLGVKDKPKKEEKAETKEEKKTEEKPTEKKVEQPKPVEKPTSEDAVEKEFEKVTKK